MESSNSENTTEGALTYATRNDMDNLAMVLHQPRQPTNLQGLLRFAMEATKAEDAPGTSELSPMDPERRSFLEDALKTLTVDVAKVLMDGIKVLSDREKMNAIQLGQELPEDVATAFTNIQEYIGDIDMARDFVKIGGLSVFPVCFGSENENVRMEAATLLAEVTQNNPYAQARALEVGLLCVLMQLAHTEEGDNLASCLYAISSITRGFGPATEELFARGGAELLAELVRNENVRVRTKAAFLIKFLISNHPEARPKFLENDIITSIAAALDRGLDGSTSCLLHVLREIVDNKEPPPQLKDQAAQMKVVLEKIENTPKIKQSEYFDERKVLKCVLKIVRKLPDVEVLDDDEADR